MSSLARQEPALNWLVAQCGDGVAVVVTDVASGWIPPGVVLPAGVRVLEPQRRSGCLDDWVSGVVRSARYKPGDRICGNGLSARVVSEEPFAVIDVDGDLGRRLSDAAGVVEGVPRIAHTLVKASVAGAGVSEAEMDVLRVHVQMAVQELLAGYPDVKEQMVVACALLGAAEAMAAGQSVLAAYHMAWYEVLAGRKVWQ
jgi:hypothetical protein